MTTETVVLEVHITQDEHGRVSSFHDFQTPEDEKRSLGWPNTGVQQIAHALLTEAARREAYMTALVQMTKQEDFLSTYAQASDEDKAKIEKELSGAVQIIHQRTLGKMGPDIAREVLEMMVQSPQSDG